MTASLAQAGRAQAKATPAGLFLLAWLGQLSSTLALTLSEFGLGVWVYQQSGSMTQFSMVLVFAVAPGIVIGPWAGSVVDRCDRRRVIIAADSLIMLGALVLGLLLSMGRLQLWHIYANTALASVCQAFRDPAYLAAGSALLPKDQLARFAGLMKLGSSLARIAGPLLAGVALATIGLPWIIALNLPACLFGVATLLLIPFPVIGSDPHGQARSWTAAFGEFGAALAFLRRQRLLLQLVLYGAAANFIHSLVLMLLRPMVLATHSEIALGTILSAGAVGTLLGSLVMIAWRRPSRLVAVMLAVDLFFALTVAATGAVTSVVALGACTLLSMACMPIFQGAAQIIWQLKVPLDMQGRMFALNDMLVNASIPVAALLGGLLADHFFEPWLLPGGLLAGTAGLVVGTGAGRGTGLMFVLAGLLAAGLTVAMLCRPGFRRMDALLPDAH